MRPHAFTTLATCMLSARTASERQALSLVHGLADETDAEQ
jgi:hypothetical protein